MTREEKLQQAADNFSEAHKYEENLDFLSLRMAFEEGVAWADRNPDFSSLWHDASEEPKGTYIVLCDGLDNRQWVVDYLHIDMSYANWQDYADAISVIRWAYITDLLPKGGGQ